MKKYRFDAPTIAKLLEMEWWNGDEDEIKRVREYEFQVEDYIMENYE